MNTKQIVDAVLDAHPQISRGHAAAVLREIVRQLHAELSATEEGRVSVPGLGVFVVRHNDVEKDGVSTKVRRTAFRLSPVQEVSDTATDVPVRKKRSA